MKISVMVIMLCLWTAPIAQTTMLEKQALASVQHLLASDLDDKLPKRPFQTWLNELTGAQAGVVWQLTECGERMGAVGEPDLPACVEINAGLPDRRKVIIAIRVGTFKKGMIGKPSFFRAVLESDEELLPVNRLCDMPEALQAASNQQFNPVGAKPARRSVDLPQLNAGINFPFYVARVLPTATNSNIVPHGIGVEEVPPPPTAAPAQELQTLAEGLLRGSAITKVKPNYPPSARKMNALGPVEVKILISPNGRVIEARAISGHLALRGAAVEAAYQWVFKPTILNHVPVKVQGVLTFIFAPGEN